MAANLTTVAFSKEELSEFVQKCLNFVEIFTAVEFYPYQKEFATAIIADIVDGRSNTLTGLFARQSGKSETMANVSAGLMVLLPRLAVLMEGKKYVFPQLAKFRKGVWVGIFTPSDNQSETTFKRLKGKLDSVNSRVFFEDNDFAPIGAEHLSWASKTQRYCELNNGSSCLMMSANKQANIESKTYHVILLDESQDLDGFVVNKSIVPMGAATNATMVATGTPGVHKGYFHSTIEFNKHEQTRSSVQQLHFEYDYLVCQKYNQEYRKFIQKIKRKIGEDSDEFRMAFKLHWLFERGMAVSQELFNELTRKSLNITTSLKDQDLVAGLDFGKGADSTVLTIGRPIYDEADESGRAPVEVVAWWERMGDSYETIFSELKSIMSDYSIATIACDATGVGEPLVDRLTWELPHITVLPVKFSAQQKDHLYKNFLLMLEEKKCWWPGDSRLRKRKYWQMFEQQMLNLQKEYKNGYLSCHGPLDQKNAHDDFPDSLALMLWCVFEDSMPVIQTSDRKIYYGKNWYEAPSGANEFKLR